MTGKLSVLDVHEGRYALCNANRGHCS